MKKITDLFRFIGRYYIAFIIVSVLVFALGILCIPFVDGTWWMPLGHLLSEQPNISVGIVLILVGLSMPLLALKCKYKKQKYLYIVLDVLIIADGVLAIIDLIGPNLIFDIAFLLIATELYGYAFFKNPEEPTAAFDILEAGISAIILTVVIVCNICGGFTFVHPVALPKTLGILTALLGVAIFVIALLYRLPKGTEERARYDLERHLRKHEKEGTKCPLLEHHRHHHHHHHHHHERYENVSEKEVEKEEQNVSN